MATALTAVHDQEIALGAVVDVFVPNVVPIEAGMPMGLLLALTYAG